MNRITTFITAITAGLLALVSCEKETAPGSCLPYEGDPDGSAVRAVTVSCTVPGGEPDTKSSYAAGESTVREVSLFVFDSSGSLVSSGHHTTSSGISLTLPVGTYSIWALANMGDVTSGIGSLSALRSCTRAVTNSGLSSAFPMSGGGSYTIGASTTSVSVQLERLVARYTFSLDTSDITEGTLKLSSVSLRNIAGAVRPLSAWGVTSTSQLLSTGDSSSAQDVTSLNGSGQAVFYVPENCQGTESGITAAKDKNPDYSYSRVNPALCTYLEVKCTYVKAGEVDNLTYRMYLGGNATSSFDVQRNRSYSVVLQPSSENIHAATWKCESELVATVTIFNNATLSSVNPAQLTVAENCFLAVRDASGNFLPVSSCTSDDSDFTSALLTKSVGGKSGVCASLQLCAARSATYHVRTTSGLEMDVDVTATKPQVSLPQMGYITLDGYSVSGSPVWSKNNGAGITSPSTFFNSTAAQRAFNNTLSLSCSSATRQVNFSSSTSYSVASSSAATVGRCLDLEFGDGMSKVYLRMDNYDGGGLQTMLDGLQSSGYYRIIPVLQLNCPNILVRGTFTCMIPWTNKASTKHSTVVNDYSIIPAADLKSGLSHSGSVPSLLPYKFSSYDIPVNVTLSRNGYTSYVSAVSYRIPAGGTSASYTFNGTKHPAGRHALTAHLTNAVSGETLDVQLGQVDCYCHIPVATQATVTDVGQGGTWIDDSSRESCLWVSLYLSAHWLYTCSSSQDVPVAKFHSDMKNNAATKAMIRGTINNSSDTSSASAGSGIDNSSLQVWGFYEPYDYPGCSGGCDLWVYGTYYNQGQTVTGDIGTINSYGRYSTQDELFRLDCHYTESLGNYYNLFDYTGSTTTGSYVTEAHWPYNSNYDDNGKGYYILQKAFNVTRFSNYLEFVYGD